MAETARLAERLRFDLTSDHGYRYPGAEDPDADRKLAELCAASLRRPLRRHGARAGGGCGRLEEELRVIRTLRLSGFFLLHADLLELAREVAREVRGPSRRGRCCRPGAGAARASARSSAT